MCGIAGVFDISGCPVDRLEARLRHMNAVQQHRGPDGEGLWTSPSAFRGIGPRPAQRRRSGRRRPADGR